MNAAFLHFGVDKVVSSNDVRVLGVTLSSDLIMDKRLQRLQGVLGRFSSASATATCPAITGFRVSLRRRWFIAFVISRIDCWRAHRRLRLTTYSISWMWLHVLLVIRTRKYERGLRQLMHVDLYWLDVTERVKFKLMSMVRNCLHHKAPGYLMDYCIPISDVTSRRHLRSARRRYFIVPRHSLSSYGRRALLLPVAHRNNCLELI